MVPLLISHRWAATQFDSAKSCCNEHKETDSRRARPVPCCRTRWTRGRGGGERMMSRARQGCQGRLAGKDVANNRPRGRSLVTTRLRNLHLRRRSSINIRWLQSNKTQSRTAAGGGEPFGVASRAVTKLEHALRTAKLRWTTAINNAQQQWQT